MFHYYHSKAWLTNRKFKDHSGLIQRRSRDYQRCAGGARRGEAAA